MRTLIVLLVFISGCSPMTYRAHFDSSADPEFNLSNAKTIGVLSTHWMPQGKKLGMDELREKEFLFFFKKEFEKRGYLVFFIPKDRATVGSDGLVSLRDLTKSPDLIFMMGFAQEEASVDIPGQSLGYISGAAGGYASHSTYKHGFYNLHIQGSLWAEKPAYSKRIWQAQVNKQSRAPDLGMKGRTMIRDLMIQKFNKYLRKKKGGSKYMRRKRKW